MTERQTKLIEFLKKRDWVKQQVIYHYLKDYYDDPRGKTFHATRTRHQIAKDIRQINESSEPYVILSSNIGIRLASEKEAQILAKANIKSTLCKLNREKKKLKKLIKIYGDLND